MFDGRWRKSFEEGLKPVGANLRRTGITADHLTATGVVMAAAASIAIANGALRAGLLLLVLCALPDLLDGAVAKASGTAGPRGAFFDSVSDRVTDALLLVRRRLVPLHHPPRPDRGAADGRARRIDAHLLRAGQGRVARLRRAGRPHGARRADHRPRRRPPLRLGAHRRAVADAGPHPGHRGAAVREGVAAGVGGPSPRRPPSRWKARRAARPTERAWSRRQRTSRR